MSEFTQGKWEAVFSSLGEYPYYVTTNSEGNYHQIAFVDTEANARLIAATPEMYKIICDFLRVDKQKACAATAKNDPAYMMALIAQNGVVNMAKALVARIDGTEAKDE